MADTVHFELVSPERLLMDAEVASVVVPGSEGDFTVLPGHAPVMSTIRPGVVEVDGGNGGDVERLFVRGGFAEVTPSGLVILAEEAVSLADISRADLERRLQNAREDLEDAKSDDERHMASEAISRLEALLAAAS